MKTAERDRTRWLAAAAFAVAAGSLFLQYALLLRSASPAVGPGMATLPIRIYTFVEYSSAPTISAISTTLIAAWLVIGVPIYARFLSVKHA